MKNYIYLLFILVFFASCEESELTNYKEKDAVYFQLQKTDFTQHFNKWDDWLQYKGDSLVYNFNGYTTDSPSYIDKDTIWIQVNVLGKISSQDRYFKVGVNQGSTTAEEGVHYEALKPQYLMKADTIRASFPVVIYNHESLGEEPYTLDIVVESNDTFKSGLEGRTNVRILISNNLVRPLIWYDEGSGDLFRFLGPYSKAKHRVVLLTNGGIPLPHTNADLSALISAQGRWVIYFWNGPMNDYLEANEVLDEDGNRVNPWDWSAQQ